MTTTVVAAAESVVGLVREHNEDSYRLNAEDGVYVVADGMGGHASGEIASKLVADSIFANWTKEAVQMAAIAYAKDPSLSARQELLEEMQKSVRTANSALLAFAAEKSESRGMGTTLVAFLVAGSDAFFVHVGDSRAYLVRDNIPVLLSEDHTVASRLRAAGIERGEETPTPQRWQGVLTNAMGMAEDMKVTSFHLPLYCGDRLMICSDGVHDYLSEVEVGGIISKAASPALAVQALIEHALDSGGADNATAIVVKVIESERKVEHEGLQSADDAAIAACPLFAHMNPEQVVRTLRITTPRQYQNGRVIPQVALEDKVAYVVLSGSLRRVGENIETGALLYPEGLVRQAEGQELNESWEAESEVRLLMIRRNDVEELVRDSPGIGEVLYASLAELAVR